MLGSDAAGELIFEVGFFFRVIVPPLAPQRSLSVERMVKEPVRTVYDGSHRWRGLLVVRPKSGCGERAEKEKQKDGKENTRDRARRPHDSAECDERSQYGNGAENDGCCSHNGVPANRLTV